MTNIHTYDIFDSKDKCDRQRLFDLCHEKALTCGLTCRCYPGDIPKLELWGTKSNMLRYYFTTLFLCDQKIKGIIRLISILL